MLQLRKRLSAEFSLRTGDEEDFAKKVIEIASERLSKKLDSMIASSETKPIEFSYDLVSTKLLLGFRGVNTENPIVTKLINENITPLIEKAQENGVTLTIKTKPMYDSGAHLADEPAKMFGTLSPNT